MRYKYLISLVLTVVIAGILCNSVIIKTYNENKEMQMRKTQLESEASINYTRLTERLARVTGENSNIKQDIAQIEVENEKFEKEYSRKLKDITKFYRSDIISAVTECIKKSNVELSYLVVLKEPKETAELSLDILGCYSIEVFGTLSNLSTFLKDLEEKTIHFSTGALSLKVNKNTPFLQDQFDNVTVNTWFDKEFFTDGQEDKLKGDRLKDDQLITDEVDKVLMESGAYNEEFKLTVPKLSKVYSTNKYKINSEKTVFKLNISIEV